MDELEEVTEVAVENAIVPSNKKPKDLNRKTRKITQDQVLEEQYKALVLKQENLKLANRKQDIFRLKTSYFNLAEKAVPRILQSLAKNWKY